MRTYIALVALTFALAVGVSMIALSVHVDRAHLHAAGHLEEALLVY
jgi:hypothetical protein